MGEFYGGIRGRDSKVYKTSVPVGHIQLEDSGQILLSDKEAGSEIETKLLGVLQGPEGTGIILSGMNKNFEEGDQTLLYSNYSNYSNSLVNKVNNEIVTLKELSPLHFTAANQSNFSFKEDEVMCLFYTEYKGGFRE